MGSVPGEDPAYDLASTLYYDHVATTVVARLADAGVRAVLLKGASFRDLFYDIGELRPYTDVDVLIPPTGRRSAAEVLEAMGFVDTFAGAAPSETSPFATEFRGRRVFIDVHRSLPGVTVPEADAWAVLSAHTTTMVLGRERVEVLDDAGRCLHAALNAASDAKARSREDVRRAVGRLPEPTWRAAVVRAEELGARASLAAGLALVPEAEDLRRSLGLVVAVPVGVALRARGAPPGAVGLHRLLTTRGVRERAAFLARRLVPTPSGMRYWSPMASRGRAGMAAAYLWRPFHLLWHAPAAFAALVRTWRDSRARPG